jgi:hypothetical protein
LAPRSSADYLRGTSTYINYTVMSSPGEIKQWRTMIQIDNGDGPHTYFIRTSQAPDKVQRMNPTYQWDGTQPAWLRFEVWGGNGACHTTFKL